MISIHQLTRRYGSNVAVRDMSTEIKRGEIVGLLGHNGAGKTTVMKVLTGYLDATSGTVEVDGRSVATDRSAVQKRIGYLPENAPLYPEMTVQEYLAMMAELRGVASQDIPRAVARAIVATDLTARATDAIATLSKGLRQRVGIAQAIIHEPDVLVLDEPTNGLDPMQIQAIRDLIRRLGERATVILSTHILQEIEAVCDRVLVLIQGELVADAPIAELIASRRIRLELDAGAQQVESTLSGLDAVTAVRPTEGSSDVEAWAIEWTGDAPPVPAIVAAAQAAGWTVRAIAPEIRTLEHVFKELQQAHIDRHAGGAA